MRFARNFLYFFYLSILVLPSFVKSSTILVFEDYDPNAFRVVTFDSKKQKLYNYETATKPAQRTLSKFFSIPNVDLNGCPEMQYTLTYDVKGNLSIVPTQAHLIQIPQQVESFLIFSNKEIFCKDVGQVTHIGELSLWCWSNRALVTRSPTQITQLVPKPKNERQGDFPISCYDNADMYHLARLPSSVKGDFGELLTKLTMYSFGYRCFPSIYGGNSGLDGIFQSTNGQFLIISQTKMGDSNPRAKSLMKKELNERHIHERLKKMLELGNVNVKQTRELIMRFIRDNPAHIYKLAHCILDKGIAQVLLEQFNIQELPKEGMQIYGASAEEKIKALKTTLTSFSASPKEQGALALLASPTDLIPCADMMEMVMQLYHVDEKTSVQILDFLKQSQSGSGDK